MANDQKLAGTIIDDQAKEIERLRAALQRIADMCPATCELTLAHEMADNAIAALTDACALGVTIYQRHYTHAP